MSEVPGAASRVGSVTGRGRPQASAGQPIGVVGTSGHSSGPHLHLDIHTGNPATEANAVDPVSFLRSVGGAVPT